MSPLNSESILKITRMIQRAKIKMGSSSQIQCLHKSLHHQMKKMLKTQKQILLLILNLAWVPNRYSTLQLMLHTLCKFVNVITSSKMLTLWFKSNIETIKMIKLSRLSLKTHLISKPVNLKNGKIQTMDLIVNIVSSHNNQKSKVQKYKSKMK